MADGRRIRSRGTALALLILAVVAFEAFQLTFSVPQTTRARAPGFGASGRHGRLEGQARSVTVAASESETAASQAYFTGIGWYLMHFVVSICNDGIMKFLGENLPPFQIVFL